MFVYVYIYTHTSTDKIKEASLKHTKINQIKSHFLNLWNDKKRDIAEGPGPIRICEY